MTLLSLCGPRHHLPPPVEVQDAKAGKDPTRTWKLRARMRAEGDRRWQTLARTLRQALIEHDLVGIRGISRLPHGDKTEGFGLWLREELRQKVLGYDGRWLQPYVAQAAAIAQGRATELAAGGVVDPSRVQSMGALAASELRGICEAAQQQITRAVTHCLMANATPYRTAGAAAKCIRVMRDRTRAMAEYIVAKTHATSTLSAFRSAGVTHVGIDPERVRKPRARLHDREIVDPEEEAELRHELLEESGLEEVDVLTAGDDDVCIVCQDISDEGPYDLDTAEGLIPAHPFCRCAFVPTSDARFASVHDKDVSARAREAPGAISYHGGEFAPDEGGWAGEPLKGSSGDPGLISTALITAKGRAHSAEREQIQAESGNYQQINVAQVRKDPELFEGLVNTFRRGDMFPYMRSTDFNGDTEHDARAVIDRIKSNLHVLWNDTSKESKALWRTWYVGAHDLISDRMEQYKDQHIGRAAMTAMYAAQSPNTMWDVNVHHGDRLLDTVFHHGGDRWDKGMADAAQGQIERGEKLAKGNERKQKNLDEMQQLFRETKRAGSYDGQRDDRHRAAWVKLWNDAHDDSSVREVGIDGKLGKPIKNKGLDDNGDPAELSGSFGTIDRIENAIRALRSNGNLKEISEALGDRHKVRSFYNNMLDPQSANNDVTIDTHAAGAGWLDPIGGKSAILGQMFGSPMKGAGSPKSTRIGVMGTYPFYADAYREVAQEVGLDRARELQSILWEHKIALFRGAPDAKKQLIRQAWQHFHDNPGVSLEQTQQRVMRIAKAGYNAEKRKKRLKDEFDYFLDEADEYPFDEG